MDYKYLKKEELLAKIEELTSADAGKAIAERDALQAKLEALEKTPPTDAGETAELKRQVKDLSARLEANEVTKGDSRLVVTIGGEPHMIMFRKLQVGDREYTDKQLAEDSAMLAKLKKEGSGAIVPVATIKARREAEERKKAERAKKA